MLKYLLDQTVHIISFVIQTLILKEQTDNTKDELPNRSDEVRLYHSTDKQDSYLKEGFAIDLDTILKVAQKARIGLSLRMQASSLAITGREREVLQVCPGIVSVWHGKKGVLYDAGEIEVYDQVALTVRIR